MENAFNDPVLGPCEMLPMRRGPGVFWGLCFLAMAIAFPIVVLLWLTDPGLDLDPRLIVLAVVATPFMPFGAWGQLKAMRCPYYLIVGPRGFATGSSGAVLWSNVVAIIPRTYRGKTVGLGALLQTPRKPSLVGRVNSLFGLLGSDGSKVVSLPKSLTYLPLDELEVLLNKYRDASGPRASGLGAGAAGATNDRKIAAVIGDYEAWPEFDVEKGCGPLLVGTEGCWPGLADGPVLWKEITSLHVDRDIFGVVVADSLGALTGPTPLSPETAVRKAPICMSQVGQAFDDRARLVADRLQRYFLDRGVPSAQWPVIDLTPGSAKRAF